MRLLCLSNGHGEDAIALRILQALQLQEKQLELLALPIVGEGNAYTSHGIPIAGAAKQMPSGGFIYMDGRQLVRDLQQGLLQLTWLQLQTVREWAQQGGVILAVGDIVPLLFAWWSGAPYAFVGTAKSEYHLRDEQGALSRRSWFEQLESSLGSAYLPWERALMRHPRCKAVFPRDALTAARLRRWKIPALDLGNPMMDGLDPTGVNFGSAVGKPGLTLTLLPGSRAPEAYENWQTILQAAEALLSASLPQHLLFLAAIAPSLELTPLQQALEAAGWQGELSSAKIQPDSLPTFAAPRGSSSLSSGSSFSFRKATATLILTSAFNDCLHQADLAIAMAGTATEQFVGLGKPAIILPGKGPQFTPSFAEAQSRLLGISVILVESPSQVIDVVSSLLQDTRRLQDIRENGQRRMGEAGAAARIAACLETMCFRTVA
ncbi:hypothetical protein IFO70_09565 [Phormidium tenue FACHB-886]|nr:hypothetical protein [Phormidium tenue FACHB-886]